MNKSSPRNHPYRTGHRLIEGGLFCVVFNAEFDRFRDLAYNLHLQPIFRRANRNALDQATEDLQSLITNLRLAAWPNWLERIYISGPIHHLSGAYEKLIPRSGISFFATFARVAFHPFLFWVRHVCYWHEANLVKGRRDVIFDPSGHIIVNLMLSAAPRAHSSVSDLGAPLNEERLSGPAEGSSLGYLASWPSRDLSGKVIKRYDAHSSRSESVRVAAFLLKHIEAEVS